MSDGLMRDVLKLFDAYVQGHQSGAVAQARSAEDKEYFVQDWVRERADAAGFLIQQQGRNSYPDFWFTAETVHGNEVKSLLRRQNGQPARKDVDFNSTIPRPVVEARRCLISFALYQKGTRLDRTIDTICLADVAVINADVDLVHVNESVPGFGSYGDGHVRNRKMYRFPTPFTIAGDADIDIKGLPTLILATDALASTQVANLGLRRLGTIKRLVAPRRLASFVVDLVSGEHRPQYGAKAGGQPQEKEFAVWTPQP